MKKKSLFVFIILSILFIGCQQTKPAEATQKDSENISALTASEKRVDNDSSVNNTLYSALEESENDDEKISEDLDTTTNDISLSQNSNDTIYLDSDFYLTEISDELFSKIYGKSYKENCTIPREDLRYVHVLHKNIQGESLPGEIICNKAIAADLLEIFNQLYIANYPIESIKLVDEYNANDELSMSNNNTSCFNFRFISNTTKLSNHSEGLAIDINPLYNPYVKIKNDEVHVEPTSGIDYVDRTKDFDYKIDESDLAYQLFTQHGFTWGGSWKNSKDYQHFEKKLD